MKYTERWPILTELAWSNRDMGWYSVINLTGPSELVEEKGPRLSLYWDTLAPSPPSTFPQALIFALWQLRSAWKHVRHFVYLNRQSMECSFQSGMSNPKISILFPPYFLSFSPPHPLSLLSVKTNRLRALFLFRWSEHTVRAPYFDTGIYKHLKRYFSWKVSDITSAGSLSASSLSLCVPGR